MPTWKLEAMELVVNPINGTDGKLPREIFRWIHDECVVEIELLNQEEINAIAKIITSKSDRWQKAEPEEAPAEKLEKPKKEPKQ